MIEKLTQHAIDNGIDIIDADMPCKKLKGLYSDDLILISKGLSEADYTCVLAEELGHYETSHGHILDQRSIANIKQEKRALDWAYDTLVPLEKLVDASIKRVRGRHDLADYLGVTESFLDAAIARYIEKYGTYKQLGNYIVYFSPLGVLEKY